MGSCKNVAEIRTTTIGRIDAEISPLDKSGSTMKVDIHADKTVPGIDFLPLHDFNITVDVSG